MGKGFLAHHGGLRTRLRGGGRGGYGRICVIAARSAYRFAECRRFSSCHNTQRRPTLGGRSSLAHHGGLEPSTPSVGGLCSIHLSYWCIFCSGQAACPRLIIAYFLSHCKRFLPNITALLTFFVLFFDFFKRRIDKLPTFVI